MLEILVLPALYAVLLTWVISQANRKRLRSWLADLEVCGLQLDGEPSPVFRRLCLSAKSGPLGVRIEESSDSAP